MTGQHTEPKKLEIQNNGTQNEIPKATRQELVQLAIDENQACVKSLNIILKCVESCEGLSDDDRHKISTTIGTQRTLSYLRLIIPGKMLI